jgi:hypothetical protein
LSVKAQFWTSDGTGKKRQDFFGATRSCRFFRQEGRVNTRQSGFFPLATTSVGWVPEPAHPEGQSEAEDSERSGELCGRAADGE